MANAIDGRLGLSPYANSGDLNNFVQYMYN